MSFVAKEVNFCGIDGYYVTQFKGDDPVCEQFWERNSFLEFCTSHGIKPEFV